MNDQWLIWCGLNAEQDAIAKALGDECISIYGSLSMDEKIRREELWRTGQVRVLVTKPDIMGWGVNWQHCYQMIFVGLSDSYEEYFQCLRRCWRFGQAREVKAYIVLSEPEEVIYRNVLAKEKEAEKLSAELIRNAAEYERAELSAGLARTDYRAERELLLPGWLKG